jgi:hypothetical protein
MDPTPMFVSDNPDFAELYDALVDQTWAVYQKFHGIKDT